MLLRSRLEQVSAPVIGKICFRGALFGLLIVLGGCLDSGSKSSSTATTDPNSVANAVPVSADGSVVTNTGAKVYSLAMTAGVFYRVQITSGLVTVAWDPNDRNYGAKMLNNETAPAEFNFKTNDADVTAYFWADANHTFTVDTSGAALTTGPGISAMSGFPTVGTDGQPFTVNMTRTEGGTGVLDRMSIYLMEEATGASYAEGASLDDANFPVNTAQDLIVETPGDLRVTHPITRYHAVWLLNQANGGGLEQASYLPVLALNKDVNTLQQRDTINNKFAMLPSTFPVVAMTLSNVYNVSCSPKLTVQPLLGSSTVAVGGSVTVTLVSDADALASIGSTDGINSGGNVSIGASVPAQLTVSVPGTSTPGEKILSISLLNDPVGNCSTLYTFSYDSAQNLEPNYIYRQRESVGKENAIDSTTMPLLKLTVQ